MAKKVHNRILTAALSLFSIFFLFFALKSVGFDKIADAFKRVGWLGAAVLVTFGILENGSDALALCFAMPKKIKLIRVFPSNCIGALVNYIIPWEAGELAKIALLKGPHGAENSIKGIILWNYVFKLSKACALLSMLLISLLLGADFEAEHFFIVLAASGLAFLPYFGVMILLKFNVSTRAVRLIQFVTKKDAAELRAKAEKMDYDLNCFKKERPRDFYLTIIIQFIARYFSLMTFVLCTRFAGFDSMTLSTVVFAYCAVTLSNYFAAVIPMKLGVDEGVGYAIFAFLGLDGSVGLLIKFIIRIKSIIAMSLASLLIVFNKEH